MYVIVLKLDFSKNKPNFFPGADPAVYLRVSPPPPPDTYGRWPPPPSLNDTLDLPWLEWDEKNER